jgi:hypothetical protein
MTASARAATSATTSTSGSATASTTCPCKPPNDDEAEYDHTRGQVHPVSALLAPSTSSPTFASPNRRSTPSVGSFHPPLNHPSPS